MPVCARGQFLARNFYNLRRGAFGTKMGEAVDTHHWNPARRERIGNSWTHPHLETHVPGQKQRSDRISKTFPGSRRESRERISGKIAQAGQPRYEQ